MSHASKHAFQKVDNLTHPFQAGETVRACRIAVVRRPLFIPATIEEPIAGIADMYLGRLKGERRLSRFLAHGCCFDTHQAEAALMLHFRASLDPGFFYASNEPFEQRFREER